jgi:hypothetical protein
MGTRTPLPRLRIHQLKPAGSIGNLGCALRFSLRSGLCVLCGKSSSSNARQFLLQCESHAPALTRTARASVPANAVTLLWPKR